MPVSKPKGVSTYKRPSDKPLPIFVTLRSPHSYAQVRVEVELLSSRGVIPLRRENDVAIRRPRQRLTDCDATKRGSQ